MHGGGEPAVSVVLFLLSSVCAVTPMLGMLVLVWWLDRYDREPVWLVATTFLWGALGSVPLTLMANYPVAILSRQIIGPINQHLALAVETVILAPLVEEPAKALILLLVIFTRHFDNMTDGFVYGAAAGLGFGMTENFMYFASEIGDSEQWLQTVFIRTLYSAMMHMTASAIVGAALGFGRFSGAPGLIASGFAGLSAAIGVHALWNGLLTLEGATGTGAAFLFNVVIFPIEVLLAFCVFQACLLEESLTIRRELGEEANRGLIPATHAGILGSWWQRNRADWVPIGVNHPVYVEAATTLAMRKKQARLTSFRGQSAFYDREVERLRTEIRDLLQHSRERDSL